MSLWYSSRVIGYGYKRRNNSACVGYKKTWHALFNFPINKAVAGCSHKGGLHPHTAKMGEYRVIFNHCKLYLTAKELLR
ncbi:hypothetical protein SAMN04515679_1088 [Pelosinus fermentans]|jgi:hypothetical protein|uniref:Uncharacterized protein n=1 Tax=Pelosinus fermentans B4 TaxID=1149862 RepID=I8RAZ8_9FIRM|nr:hypothetical protein FB4_4688 [Pelosinus fermentans B4]OAM93014.1 hypothetical protein FR7_01030 [Pelosinus fermentans DSM 17108]SDQ64135.1 hypothetical protein SAMN04515679_1088 [Pelosinus fermentans]